MRDSVSEQNIFIQTRYGIYDVFLFVLFYKSCHAKTDANDNIYY